MCNAVKEASPFNSQLSLQLIIFKISIISNFQFFGTDLRCATLWTRQDPRQSFQFNLIKLEKYFALFSWRNLDLDLAEKSLYFSQLFSHNINFSLSSCVISSLYQDWSDGGVIYDCKLRSEKAPFYEYFEAFSAFLHISPTKESFFRNSPKNNTLFTKSI